jgi:hypothetical protein
VAFFFAGAHTERLEVVVLVSARRQNMVLRELRIDRVFRIAPANSVSQPKREWRRGFGLMKKGDTGAIGKSLVTLPPCR